MSDSDDVYFTFNFTGQFPSLLCSAVGDLFKNDPGTAVEVYYIAIDSVSSWTTNTSVEYSIDGVRTASTSRDPMGERDYFYNQTLFRISELENTEHMLQVKLQRQSVLLVCMAT